jgi:hypothetical protein
MMRILTIVLLVLSVFTFSCNEDGSPGKFSGKSGSLARFAATDTHLFSVDDQALNVFQIMDNGSLEQVNSRFIGPGVETIFALDHRLYIGTNSAMVIYDIINPASPNFVSQYSHFVACDPVVVQDTLAFVTVRSSNCRGAGQNTLDIINVKNPESPFLLSNYNLESPYGLGVDGSLLFVCEGEKGLKVFNISNPYNAVLVRNYTDVDALDVITHNGVLIVRGLNGIMQYDYSDYNSIKKLSEISISR